MNPKKTKVRITKPGDYHGRIGKIVGQNSADNSFLIKLKNKTIIWPAVETDHLKLLG